MNNEHNALIFNNWSTSFIAALNEFIDFLTFYLNQKDVNIESAVDDTKHIGNTPSSDSKPDTSLVSDQNLDKTLLCNQNLDKTLAEIDQVPKSDQQPGETISSVEKGSLNP